MRYRVTDGTLTVKARSSVHDTTTVWNRLSGEITADPETLATAGATGRFEVDMTAFDAGDFLKNRKLRKDFELERYPRATFTLRAVRDVTRATAGGAAFSATAEGTLDWRGRQVVLVLRGQGTLDAMSVAASATFELDIRDLGMSAPRFLMFKVEDEVSVTVRFRGTAAP
jgi:polyisoprenoid-binding protein YceI